MNTLIKIAVCLSICYLPSPEIALAKSNASSCSAISTVTKKLKKQKSNSIVNVRRESAAKTWKNAPKGDILEIDTRDSFHSTEFEISSSRMIISQCSGIVAVQFNQIGTDGVSPYILVKGRVKQFQCPKGMTVENYPRPFKWGHFCGA